MMVFGLMHHLPKRFDDVECRLLVALAGGYLEIAHLSVEGRRHLSWGKRHRKLVEKYHATNFKVVRELMRHDDGARPQIGQCTCSEVAVLQVEVDAGLAIQNNTQSVVVDNEWWLLLHNEFEHRRISMHDAKLIIKIHLLAYLLQIRS